MDWLNKQNFKPIESQAGFPSKRNARNEFKQCTNLHNFGIYAISQRNDVIIG